MSNRKSLLFVLPLMMLVLMACRIGSGPFNRQLIEGSGNAASEERQVSNIERVTLSDIGELTIVQGDEEGMTVEADDNLLPYIETRMRGRELVIKFQDNISVSTDTPVRYTLRVKDLNEVSVSGSGAVLAEALDVNDLSVDISGSGQVRIDDLQVKDLDIRASGSGSFHLVGAADSQDIQITGSGNYQGADLMSQTAKVRISGSGDVTVWAVNKLDVRITGFGSVKYYDRPDLSQSITGSGSIENVGEHK